MSFRSESPTTYMHPPRQQMQPPHLPQQPTMLMPSRRAPPAPTPIQHGGAGSGLGLAAHASGSSRGPSPSGPSPSGQAQRGGPTYSSTSYAPSFGYNQPSAASSSSSSSSSLPMAGKTNGSYAQQQHLSASQSQLRAMQASQPVRQGPVNVKEEGIKSFLWSKKWMVLKNHTLGLHKNEVRPGVGNRRAATKLMRRRSRSRRPQQPSYSSRRSATSSASMSSRTAWSSRRTARWDSLG